MQSPTSAQLRCPKAGQTPAEVKDAKWYIVTGVGFQAVVKSSKIWPLAEKSKSQKLTETLQLCIFCWQEGNFPSVNQFTDILFPHGLREPDRDL